MERGREWRKGGSGEGIEEREWRPREGGSGGKRLSKWREKGVEGGIEGEESEEKLSGLGEGK